MSLKIDKVAKQFGRFPALAGVSLEVAEGEFLALLGPSGSGKTTLLRILAGLERPDSGTVRFNDEDFLSLSARDRRVGMVFQHYALFRHITIAENIAFGLKVRPRSQRPPKAEIDAKVEDLLRLVQLDGLGKRYPAQLSGGQRQRVALARALAIEPRVLLLDEPFGALDAKVRRELRRWLRDIHEQTGVTTVFVTHDQEEAMEVADRVAILNRGELVQVGDPQEVYDHPANAFVFDFLGAATKLPGQVRGGELIVGDWKGEAPAGAPEGAVDYYFRPHEVSLKGDDSDGIPVAITSITPRGPARHLVGRIGAEEVLLELPSRAVPAFAQAGRTVRLAPDRPVVFAAGADGAGDSSPAFPLRVRPPLER